jgi:hypothetical protein
MQINSTLIRFNHLLAHRHQQQQQTAPFIIPTATFNSSTTAVRPIVARQLK